MPGRLFKNTSLESEFRSQRIALQQQGQRAEVLVIYLRDARENRRSKKLRRTTFHRTARLPS